MLLVILKKMYICNLSHMNIKEAFLKKIFKLKELSLIKGIIIVVKTVVF